jgi:hypothetical protein
MIGSLLAMIYITEKLQVAAPDGSQAAIAWPWFTLIGTIVCIGLAYLTRLLMPKNTSHAVGQSEINSDVPGETRK